MFMICTFSRYAPGSARCWGDNSRGQLGYGNTVAVSNATAAAAINFGAPAGVIPVQIATGGIMILTYKHYDHGATHAC